MPSKDRRSVDVVGLVAFTAVVALCILVDFRTGLRAFGVWMIITAIVQQRTGRLPIGWDGKPPSARTMAILNLVVGLVGLAILAWPDGVVDLFF